MELTVTTRQVGETALVSPGGEVDVESAPRLVQVLSDLEGSGVHDVVLDLEDVEFLDSSGLNALVRASTKAQEQDGRLDLVCTRPHLLKVFRVSGLVEVLTIHDSVDAALAPGRP